MERYRERIAVARQALDTLEEVLAIAEPSRIVRDAGIQRFEYTLEAVWKAAQSYLREFEGLDVGSPKGVVRACRRSALLSEDDAVLALQMIDDRNLTVHTYNEPLAQMIFDRLPQYARLMRMWLNAMNSAE
ncbi:MAG: HI0074 family nucleotidyltransferase substrate-binding subunit [Anaerolineae bacterium]|nr:nucleotidyltransferase substrate binding protein [Candidatus Roseilinea sp.]MDW8450884.1 HI0074 family nucleotidyltransferase substrate-binding subunit [Anaerolineae bacterium]